ncbi:MAG: 3-dehydroquinate synthase [Spirulinaceae cyanobacterium RM2_2_10]|nr:3-dehydroquinate synthase [Spirulinaceae cyanobacterium SM2_1_0]NJO21004.1 3-dehydroquinate synthase [Spirulinaceae cyanobacterium RM2_2_10]
MLTTTIHVDLPQNAYQVAIAPGAIAQLGQHLTPLQLSPRLLLVSDENVFPHYGEVAVASLQAAGFAVATHIFPAGEPHKTLASIQQLYDTAHTHRLERRSTLLALGGGVVGDMTGFAAATWLRGVNFVQVPTTLLAMVDAAIGGKTGVNHPQGKNLIGAFYQPRAVIIDPQMLATLPRREFRAGMAEVIKYGVIWDADLFDQLAAASQLDRYDAVSPALLQTILSRSCQAKAAVVRQDEKEAGLRAILNYGHTVGHAVESLTHYKKFVHGEAVAIGMVAAGAIAQQLEFWTAKDNARQLDLIAKAQLPTQIPDNLRVADILTALQSDKKVQAGRVRFILPTAIGSVQITAQVPTDPLARVLVACGAAA